MPGVSLEEAIASPPPLIGDNPSKARKLKSREHESVLSSWAGRPTIQSFMNAIAKKHKMYLMQMKKEEKMYANFRLSAHQRHQVRRTQENEDVKKSPALQKQLQSNPVSQTTPSTDLLAQQLQKPSEANIFLNRQQSQHQHQPSNVCKVMKTGMSASNTPGSKHNPEGKSPRRDSGLVPNTGGKQVFGNILDDILARSQVGKEKIVVSRRKAALSKSVSKKVRQNNVQHNSGETGTLYEMQNQTSFRQNVNVHVNNKSDNSQTQSDEIVTEGTVSDGSEPKNININLGMPSEKKQACGIKPTTSLSSPANNIALSMSNNFVTDAQNFVKDCKTISVDNDGLEDSVGKSNPNSICDIERESNTKDSKSPVLNKQDKQLQETNAKHARSQKQCNIRYSDTKPEQLVSDHSSSETEKFDGQGINIENKNEIQSNDINALKLPVNLSYKHVGNLNRNHCKIMKLEIAPLKFSSGKNDQQVSSKTMETFVKRDSNGLKCASAKSDVPCNFTTDVRLASVAGNAAMGKEQGTVNMPNGGDEIETAITSTSLDSCATPCINHSSLPDGQIKSLDANNQSNDLQLNPCKLQDKTIQRQSATKPTVTFTLDKIVPNLETTKVKPLATNDQSNEEQLNSEMHEHFGPLSPTSVSGDLVIDLGSETESETLSTRRVKKRKSCLSMSSESSHEGHNGLSSGMMRDLSDENLQKGVEGPEEEEAKNSARLPGIGTFLSRLDGLPAIASLQSYVTKNSNDGKQVKSENEDIKLHQTLKWQDIDDESKTIAGVKRKQDSHDHKNEEASSYTARVTRSSYHGKAERLHDQRASNSNRKKKHSPRKPDGRNFKYTKSSPRQAIGGRTKGQPRQSSRKKTLGTPCKSNKSGHRGVKCEQQSEKQCGTRRERSRSPSKRRPTNNKHTRAKTNHTFVPRGETENRRFLVRKKQRQTNHSSRNGCSPSRRSRKMGSQISSRNHSKSGKHFSRDFSKGSVRENTKHARQESEETMSRGNSQKKSVVFDANDHVPSLLSLVSNEALDITVEHKKTADDETNYEPAPKQKRKKKRPKESYLQKEKEMREKAQGKEPEEFVPRVPCVYYRVGKCAKGATCLFKHEKIKELCHFYLSHGCDKNLDGMCPKMHGEFPCIFFHKPQNCCTSGPACKFSHAPLTDETREILEKYIKQLGQKRHSLPNSPVMGRVDSPMSQQNEPSTSCDLPIATNVNPQFSNETKPRAAGLHTVSTPDGTINSSLITEFPPKNIVGGPRVKRLCSLATYKSPLTFSPMANVGKVESQEEKLAAKTETTSNKRSFLPGLFKER